MVTYYYYHDRSTVEFSDPAPLRPVGVLYGVFGNHSTGGGPVVRLHCKTGCKP